MTVDGRIDPDHVEADQRRREKHGIGTEDEDIGDDAEEPVVVDPPTDMVKRLRVDLSVRTLPSQ